MRRSPILAVTFALGCQMPPSTVAMGDAALPSLDGAADELTPDSGSASDVRSEGFTALSLRVFDARTGQRVAAMVRFTDDVGTALEFGNQADPPYCAGLGASLVEIGTGGALATRNGIALWRGEAVIPIGTDWQVPGTSCGNVPPHTQKIPYGKYRLTISRGLEFELLHLDVDLKADSGIVFIQAPLKRAVDTDGYLAADMHLHSEPGSTDSSVSGENRVKTEASVGIEVVVATDHDYLTDLTEPVRRLWPNPNEPPPLATVVGVEVTGNSGHFAAIPMTVEPSKPRNGALATAEASAMTPQTLFNRLHAMPTAPLIQMNHTRLGYAAYFDSGACGPSGWRDLTHLPDCSLDFDMMEVLNGFLGCDKSVHQTMEDWYALLRFGVAKTATGNSDSHYASGILAGFPRTYVAAAVDTPAGFSESEFIQSLRGHRAIATTGPFVTLRADAVSEGGLTTNTSGTVKVTLRMQAASWVNVDVVRLKVDGATVRSWPITAGTPDFRAEETLAVSADAFITAEAEGSKPLPAWIVGDYLSAKNKSGTYDCTPSDGAAPGMVPFGVTNPVFVDADGDGIWKGSQQPVLLPTPADRWIPPTDGDHEFGQHRDRSPRN